MSSERRVNDVLSDNERLRQANDALRARIERHAAVAPADVAMRPEGASDGYAWVRRYIEVALDASGAALILFTEDGRLLATNRALRDLFPDVAGRLVAGLRFDDVVAHIAGAQALDLPNYEAREHWVAARIGSRGRAAAPVVAPLVGDRWIEVGERRAGHGAFALAFQEVTEAVRQRRRRRTVAADGRAAMLQGALDHLPMGVAAFDGQSALSAWNEPFRAMLGLGLSDLREGLTAEDVRRRVGECGIVDVETAGARDAMRWIGSPSPRHALDVEMPRTDGVSLALGFRETLDGGFVVSAHDVSAERRAAAEVGRVRDTLEQRVFDRTSALVELNDKLVQEIAERRAIEAEMRRARDAAEAANLSKTRFLAAASHDLLQPLNAAKLFISALTARDLPPEDASIARRVSRAFDSVEALLNALLDISRLDAGGGDVHLADFPVSAVLDPLADEFRVLAESRGLKLLVSPSSVVVRSDRHHLRRIVQNLVSNALKYTESGGCLVGCRLRGGRAVIEVWDSGSGIPHSERRRIFEEFHRVPGAGGGGERGMGLGLAIVERACRLLGHVVDIRSQEGRGSVFSVALPLGDPEAAQEPDEPRPALDLSGGEDGPIVIVVEDDPAVRAATVALLEGWGVGVLEAGSADEALLAASQLGMAPDVALIDYHLAEGTGLEALRALRRAFDPNLPGILITADRSREVAHEAEAARAQILAKPVSPSKLRALLHWSRADRPRDAGAA